MNPHSISFAAVSSPAGLIFAGISIINFAILLTEAVLLLIRKQKLLPHNYIILAGQLAKLISAAVLLILPQYKVVFSLIILPCAAVCLLSGILIGSEVTSQKQLFQRLWRMIYMLCCIYITGFLVMLVIGGNYVNFS